ncbi:P-loop containing nucleoside triphosphate hydrolase protein [Lipomyces japonicus]|uniref:P-loop containing nucleoside triphosphate hydrolase protein n=1 Tax=Lipomyces japonicus TaxID=56871 RepID=UPI0034CD0C41
MHSAHSSKRNQTFTPSQLKAVLRSQDENAGVDALPYQSSLVENGKYEYSVDGESADFGGRKWVWLSDESNAFINGFIVEEDEKGMLRVRCNDDSERLVHKNNVDRVNPPKFDKANDMAELTHLNEASVVHNLHTRYMADMIYTYSGLFLVAVNPYCDLPIYNKDYISIFKRKSKNDIPPHIYAISDTAFRNMLEMNENQSILVTGESGAGKTENTKKVIQYLAEVTNNLSTTSENGSFEQQILQANPILEAFGNSQTVRNNNSSRFGKFIKIGFSSSGQISGAYIEWYLLEKSRVVTQSNQERNYHIFYQLLAGASDYLRKLFLLDGKVADYAYVKNSNKKIPGVSDKDEFKKLLKAFKIMGFSEQEQTDMLRVIAIILHIGNLEIGEERSSGQAKLLQYAQAERLCHVMGVPVDAFVKALLRPKVKAGRDWVDQSRNAAQVQFSLHALAKTLYERGFSFLVNKINGALERDNSTDMFIGVLDIAGFEIFEHNSFEQLCINYTNERLQQYFNHHMFVLEQEEYAKENIEWQFIDFGHDLQPTIDLIDKSNPIGIFSCLDEDCVMPRATDKSFTEKLHSLWTNKSDKYKPSLLNQGFKLTHYAAEVDYSTEGWLEKNKDPLNENIVQLLALSSERHISDLFSEEVDIGTSHRRKGQFRTVAQRHKEQLSNLMTQLHSTHPHFVRCILPNHQKRPKKFDNVLVLDQLRCNGVLEGIRIARTGFPNRLSFMEFRQRYEVLVSHLRGVSRLNTGYVDGQKACIKILEELALEKSVYRVGTTKVFFRAGVLAELEDRREKLLRDVFILIQSRSRGFLQRRFVNKRLYRADAIKVIAKNIRAVEDQNPWWKLYIKMQPLLTAQQETVQSLARDGEYQKVVTKLAETEAAAVVDRDRVRRAEVELKKAKERLESELALALDKEEILRRSQAKESDLQEQLAVALEDLEKLEEQCEELLETKKRADQEAQLWRGELENGARLIGRLEGEKSVLDKQIEILEQKLADNDSNENKITAEMDTLKQEMRVLKTIVSQREKQVITLEEKLKNSDSEIESRMQQSRSIIDTTNRQLQAAVRENQDLRGQITQLNKANSHVEGMAKRKEAEILVLQAELKQESNSRKSLLNEKVELESLVKDVRLKISQHEHEGEQLRKKTIQLEQERDSLKFRLKKREDEENEVDSKGHLKRLVVNQDEMNALREKVRDAEKHLGILAQAIDSVGIRKKTTSEQS